MDLDWKTIDRWLMGEAWTGSRIADHLNELCDNIGPRWASSTGEWKAVSYLCDQLRIQGLDEAALEEFELHTWEWESARAQVVEIDKDIDLLPFNRCPAWMRASCGAGVFAAATPTPTTTTNPATPPTNSTSGNSRST